MKESVQDGVEMTEKIDFPAGIWALEDHLLLFVLELARRNHKIASGFGGP
jgi:hypothetical protein